MRWHIHDFQQETAANTAWQPPVGAWGRRRLTGRLWRVQETLVHTPDIDWREVEPGLRPGARARGRFTASIPASPKSARMARASLPRGWHSGRGCSARRRSGLSAAQGGEGVFCPVRAGAPAPQRRPPKRPAEVMRGARCRKRGCPCSCGSVVPGVRPRRLRSARGGRGRSPSRTDSPS